jgi:hypothetical protein
MRLGILWYGWGGRKKPIMQDVRITHPVTSLVRQGAVQNIGGAAKAGEIEKQRKFGPKCNSVGYEFEPVIIETYGLFGDKAKEIFKRTIPATADNKNIDISYSPPLAHK